MTILFLAPEFSIHSFVPSLFQSPALCPLTLPMSVDFPVPVELTEQMVDSIEGDPATLKALALVSRSGLSHCREYLHNNVYIRAQDPIAVQRQLHRYRLSYLCVLVRQLRVDASGCSDSQVYHCITRLVGEFSSLHHIIVSENMATLATPECLTCSIPHPEYITLDIISRVFRSPCFFRVLEVVPGLSRLVMDTVSWYWGEENWTICEYASGQILPTLRMLEISYCVQQDHFLQWLYTNNHQLKTVCMSIMEGGFPAHLNATLHAMHKTLTHLDLHETIFVPDLALDLNELNSLRWLSLGCIDINWSINALCAVSLPSLVHLSLVFRITSFRSFVSGDWTRLDGALSAAFPRLSDFSLEILPWHDIMLAGGILSGTLVRLGPQVFQAIERTMLNHLVRTRQNVRCRISVVREYEEEENI